MKTASKSAKDVTDKSTEKIAQSILEKTSKTITTTISETNTHEVDNKTPDGKHIAGVCQWVNKVYEARVHNYGQRKMYDFMIPEPAAFIIFQQSVPHNTGKTVVLTPPAKLDINPNVLTESVYETTMRSYGLDPTTADPYPQDEVQILHSEKGLLQAPTSGSDIGQIFLVTMTVPAGYEAYSAKGMFASDGNFASADIQAGSLTFTVDPPAHGFQNRNEQDLPVQLDGDIPVFINVRLTQKGMSQGPQQNWIVIVSLTCRATTAKTVWQNKMWQKISRAVDTLQTEYEAKLAEIQGREDANNLIQITGTNPDDNLVTMREELKRACISIMTNRYFDDNGSIVEPKLPSDISTLKVENYPHINVGSARTEGSTVRFFEQAFEWENMSFTLYPYFWARKSTWLARLSYDDPDLLFNRFLKAGYARVSLLVRMGFASAVAHYMDFAELWGGNELPPIGSDLYLSVADEQMEQTGAPQKEYGPRVSHGLLLSRRA
jgi:hypothetical protein